MIDGGVLQIDGSIVSSTTVASGGTLAGSGLINAGVLITESSVPAAPARDPER